MLKNSISKFTSLIKIFNAKFPANAKLRNSKFSVDKKKFQNSQEHVIRNWYSTARPDRNPDANLNFDSKIPKLVYFYNPFKFLVTKFQLLKLKFGWDSSFKEKDFLYGVKQAVIVLVDIIRTQKFEELPKYTTPFGLQQITRDSKISDGDPRLKMIQLRVSDLKRAIPVRVIMLKHQGQRHCLVDVFLVGLRNISDFNTQAEYRAMQDLFNKYGQKIGLNQEHFSEEGRSKVLFSEIFVRLYREYTEHELEDWSISYFKIVNFDILTMKK